MYTFKSLAEHNYTLIPIMKPDAKWTKISNDIFIKSENSM